MATPNAAAQQAAAQREAATVDALQRAAAQAYADRDFVVAVEALSAIIEKQPDEVKWREMRAQALVDGKNFGAAIRDFDFAMKRVPGDAAITRARLLSGRGLAYEGLGDWPAALNDYDASLQLAEVAGLLPDPYILNSRGNCHASLGEWAKARESYQASAAGFQRASGFRYGRSTTPRLDGAVFAASNAALMLAQLGDEPAAMKEMQDVARRAPGSVDMRAALAALYWKFGDEAAAEASWDFACNSITVGCTRYLDRDWLQRIRRWPPVMVSYMQDFLALRSTAGTGPVPKLRA
ncbi:hypothetical protein D9Q98_000390 [Chlorella vulgaris]|uniref:Tetratricopeptide repeat protein n=1 Tax=Chlorella vulgaris TaxID=3077 RepID=A0A9D4TY33_CHLVU|nr:hypothetical protein D9Q98_000390 [Chlorella vulgaris]